MSLSAAVAAGGRGREMIAHPDWERGIVSDFGSVFVYTLTYKDTMNYVKYCVLICVL